MIPDTSSVVRPLSEGEISALKKELDNNYGLWMKHPMNQTALNNGVSIIINWVTLIRDCYQLQWTFREKFPETWSILESIADGRQFGKIYWHRLDPGINARPHSDFTNPYIRRGDAYKRYNILLDIPQGVELVFDGLKEPIADTKPLEYTLYDMAANKIHAAYNKSNKPFYAMIVDVLTPEVKVYNDLYFLNEADNPKLNRLK
jgi:hypothetical protein